MPKAARIKNGPSTTLKISRGWRMAAQISLKKKDEIRIMPFALSTKNAPMVVKISAGKLTSPWITVPSHQAHEDVVEARVLLADLVHLDVGFAEGVDQQRDGRAGVVDDDLQGVVVP